jgi:hypothetical protein
LRGAVAAGWHLVPISFAETRFENRAEVDMESQLAPVEFRPESAGTDSNKKPLRSRSKRLRKNRRSSELSREIERVEGEIRKCEEALSAWVAGDDVAMGRLFRIRTERLQLEAYLQGLRFERP